MKDARISGIIVIMGPDMSGCGRGGVVYDVFLSYAGFVKWMNEGDNHGRNNTGTILYTNGPSETFMRNSNLGRLSYFELPKKGLDGMKVRYSYSWGTVHHVRSYDVHA